MPSGSLIATSYNLGITPVDSESNASRRAFVMSNGQRVVILQTGGTLFYTTSSDGTTWSAPVSLLTDAGPPIFSRITVVGDVLHVFAPVGGAIQWSQWAYATATNTFGTITQHTLNPSSFISDCDAAWDTTNSVWHVAYLDSSNYWHVGAVNTSGVFLAKSGNAGGVGSGSTGTFQTYGLRCVPGASTFVYLLTYISGGGVAAGLYLQPLTYASAAYTVGTLETVVAGSLTGSGIRFAALELDNSSNVDIVYVDSTHLLQAKKRTGTNLYQTPINIASGVSSANPSVSLTPDSTGGLYCFYASVTNQSNAEIYVAQRLSGAWKTPALFAGGDAGGYSVPRSTPAVTSNRVDVVYQTGTTTLSVYAKAQSLGSAPNTPTITAPSGFITTLTPTATWTYQNTQAPGDTQGSYRRRTIRTSDSAVMFDSGQVSSSAQSAPWAVGNASDPNYVAAATLVYGVQYQDTIMVWDSILTPAQPSSFSAPQTWTPKQGPVPTITRVTCTAGNTASSSPATIGSPDIQATVGVTQPDGDATSQYLMTLYQADGATLVAQTGTPAGTFTTLSPTVASGSSFSTLDWSITGLVNGATYVLVVSIRDAVTGQIGSSVAWTIHTSWAGPAAPTGLTVTPNPVQGTNDLAWVNGANTTSNDTFYRLSGTTPWLPLSSNDLRITLSHFARLGTAYDYAVLGVAATGGVSALVTVLGVTLTAKYNAYGWWLNSVSDPLGTAASLGITDGQSGATASTNWEHVSKIVRDVPRGRTKPTTDAGIVDYWQAPGRVWKVLDYDHGAAGQLILNAAYAMENAHRVVLYRDPDGDSRFVTLENVKEDRPDRSARRIFMDIVEADYTPREIFV